MGVITYAFLQCTARAEAPNLLPKIHEASLFDCDISEVPADTRPNETMRAIELLRANQHHSHELLLLRLRCTELPSACHAVYLLAKQLRLHTQGKMACSQWICSVLSEGSI